MADIKFELEVISDRENGILKVSDYEENLKNAREILALYPIIDIENDEQKKVYKTVRATFNKFVKAIDRKRIDTVSDYCITFEEQCNEIKNLFDDAQKAMGEKIKEYEDKQKVVVADTTATTKYTATLKFTDEKIIKKLQDFAIKNGCELTIK